MDFPQRWVSHVYASGIVGIFSKYVLLSDYIGLNAIEEEYQQPVYIII